MRQHLTSTAVTKNRIPWTDIMNSVTYNNLWFKCYLNICMSCNGDSKNIQIVPKEMGSFKRIAVALIKLCLFLDYGIYKNFKKLIYFINFLTVTFISLFSTSTSQSIKSPGATSNILTISFGIPTFNDFVSVLAYPILLL